MMKPNLHTASQTCDSRAAADLLRAMAHPMRLAILCRLVDGELSVSGFESELGLKQPSLSQQLGLLREAGLVVTRREAKSVVYGLSDHRLNNLLEALRSFVTGSAQAPAISMTRTSPTLTSMTVEGHVTAPIQSQSPVRPPHSAINECGMFSVAGWPAGHNRG